MAPIPLRFSFATDVDTTLDILVRKTSDMEIIEDGPSAAQEPTTHTFAVGEKLLNIIDTPGIVVFDKEEPDRENFESILNHLSQEIQEIQCICILLKPNNARLVFSIIVQQVVAYLGKDIADNMMISDH